MPRARAHTVARRVVHVAVVAGLACVVALAGMSAVAAQAQERAQDIDGYAERLAAARQAVDAYIDAGAPSDPGELAAEVLGALPASERVDVAGTVVVVDNSIVRSLATQLAVAEEPGRRLELAEDIRDHLASQERALPGAGARSVPADPEALARLLADTRTRARSPVSDLLGALIERLGEAYARWQSSLADGGAAARMWSTAVTALVIALALLVVFVVARVVLKVARSTARRGPVVVEAPDGSVPVVDSEAGLPADVPAFAESLAAEGRFAEAVRALFGGAARLLAEHGHVSRTRTRTNGELLAEVGRRLPAAAAPLSGMAATFERAFFGHVEPGESGYRAAREAYGSLAETVAAGSEAGAP